MTLLPNTTRLPLAPPLAMSTAQPSPVPKTALQQQQQQQQQKSSSLNHSADTLAPRPHVPKPSWPKPRLNLKIVDASHPAARLFFRAFIATEIFEEAVDAVLTTLYGNEPSQHPDSARPAVRSITLVLRQMDGVAYTARREELADDNHKEIHMNLEHFKNVLESAKREKKEEQLKRKQGNNDNNDSSMDLDQQAIKTGSSIEQDSEERERYGAGRAAAEFHGVLVHEMVHCWQWNGRGSAPGGLIEGVADYVRMKEDLAPPHWDRQRRGERWDQGYETTAYFLEWCEKQRLQGQGGGGAGTVRQLNQWLQNERYEGDKLWLHVFGRSITELWDEYSRQNGWS